jgi:hypothetical protein
VPTARGSRDQTETGLVNPNVKAEVAFNPDSELIPVARSGGILAVLSVPSGGLIEPNKDATLIVTTGDLLEISTVVTAAYIQGRAVSLNDRHKRL